MSRETLRIATEELTVHRLWGPVSVQDCLDAAEDFVKEPTRLVLWDLQLVESFAPRGADLQRVIQITASASRPASARTAILAPRLDLFGSARQAEAYAEIEKLDYAVAAFRRREDAMAWLKDTVRQTPDPRKSKAGAPNTSRAGTKN